jgi:UDP-2-acetamido-2,6-beta-L-arabino-hexul-4-ose reductase
MKNILITGAQGFIGKNLVSKLNKNKDLNLMEVVRGTKVEDLEFLLKKSDLIYHFAGEVRPYSDDNSFRESNLTLTKLILKLLEDNNRKTPILYTSSIHSNASTNEYGKTKKASEILIENYAKTNNVRCNIYKLPHVFGEYCKPNYNSVITTWIYNTIHDLEAKVFDRNMRISYVYVQDLVEEFVDFPNDYSNEVYIEPKCIYPTTLGEVIDFIEEFKENIDIERYIINNNEFKCKLLAVYKHYSRLR